VDKAALLTASSDVKRNDMSPCWRQRLALPNLAYEKDLYVQLVLWDYSIVRNQPIGHTVLPLERALVRHSTRQPERALSFSVLPGCQQLKLTAKVSAQFSFWEEYRHKLVVLGASLLPKVKDAGTISSYVEARLLRVDPRKVPFNSEATATTECLWSARTSVVEDSTDPSWEQEFDFTLACDIRSLWLQLVLRDASTPLPDAPIGHSVIKISQAGLVDQPLKLEELPERHILDAVHDLSQATLAVSMTSEPATRIS